MIITILILVFSVGVFESAIAQSLIVHPGTTVINHGLLRLQGYENPSSNNIIVNENGEFVLEAGTVIEIPDTLLVKKHGWLLISENAVVTTLITDTFTARIILEDSARYANLSTSEPYLEVKREITGNKGWRMLASPVATNWQDMSDAFITQGFTGSTYPEKQPNLLWFNETDGGSSLQGWRKPASITDDIPGGAGVYQYIFNGAEITGSDPPEFYGDELPLTMKTGGYEYAFSNSIFNHNVTFTPRSLPEQPGSPNDTIFNDNNLADAGWNLIGNPTASSLDWDVQTAWNKTNIDNVIYMWEPEANNGNGDFLFWSSDSSVSTLGNSKMLPYRAYWVHTNAANPALTFSNDAKTLEGMRYASLPSKKTIIVPGISLSLSLSAGEQETRAFIRISEDGITGPDPMDAYRLEPLSNTWLKLFTLSSPAHEQPLLVNHLPPLQENAVNIPLFVGGRVEGKSLNGKYILHWNLPDTWPADWNISLHDHTSQKVISMIMHNQHTFIHAEAFTKSIVEEQPAIPQHIVKAVKGDKFLKSEMELPPFSIIISKGSKYDEVEYVGLKPKLLPNYPNPFAENTTIRFSLPEASHASIDVFDFRGIHVASPADATFPAGLNEIQWQPCSKTPGIYIIRLISGETTETIKAILMN
jgi:hypothetical protein